MELWEGWLDPDKANQHFNMASLLQLSFKNTFYHITSRGNQGEKMFYFDQDKRYFIKITRLLICLTLFKISGIIFANFSWNIVILQVALKIILKI